MDPYKVLKVNRNASEKEIKRAYKKLALKYHPDRYTDDEEKKKMERKFVEISNAYQKLINKEEQGNIVVGADFGSANDLFRDMFKEEGNFEELWRGFDGIGKGMFGGNMFGRNGMFGNSLDDFFGNTSFSRNPSFNVEKNRRTQKYAKTKETVRTQCKCTLEDIFQGKVKKLRMTAGDGKAQVLEIELDSSCDQGSEFEFELQDMIVIVELKIQPHGYFEKRGFDLLHRTNRKGKLTIPTLDGRTISTDFDGKRKVISGEGFMRQNGRRGDLVVTI